MEYNNHGLVNKYTFKTRRNSVNYEWVMNVDKVNNQNEKSTLM